jgi:hypothetical protein
MEIKKLAQCRITKKKRKLAGIGSGAERVFAFGA